MAQCNSLNVKLSHLQLNELKPAIKNKTQFVLRISSNMTSHCDDKINFPYELLLTNRKDEKLGKLLQITHQLILSYQKLNYLR